jgi:shikimate dehydrogenase
MTSADTSVLVGLIGSGIGQSLSPAMHEAEGHAHGLDYRYRLIDLDILGKQVDDLPDLIDQCEREGYAGLNITHPCKQAVLGVLTELSGHARALGAVNTVVLRDGKRTGHNTDWSGFAESFRRGLPDAPLRAVVQLGAGGAGAATAYAALVLGVQNLAIHDIEPDRASRLAGKLTAHFGDSRAVAVTEIDSAMTEADGLIHATPTGMANHPGLPLPAELLRPTMWVAEIVYFPIETELLRVAKAAGCRILDGGGMAVFQAAEAFRLFTGVTPDIDRMRKILESNSQ